MKPFTWNYLIWSSRRRLAQFGLVGVAGLVITVFCLLFYATALAPLRVEVLAFKSENISKQAGISGANRLAEAPAAQLDAFYRNFPNATRLPDVLDSLNRIANEQGVILEQGAYRLQPAGPDGLVRYEMTLPIKSNYMHLRGFISNLLVEWPNVSLDSVSFQRQKVSDAAMEAQIKLTVILLGRSS